MCSCLKQKLYNEQYNKSNISNLDTQNFNNFSDLLYSDKVDKNIMPIYHLEKISIKLKIFVINLLLILIIKVKKFIVYW